MSGFRKSTGVTSWKTRTGAVVPATDDYTAAQVTNAADKASASTQAFTGSVQVGANTLLTNGGVVAPLLEASGITGAPNPAYLAGSTIAGAPTTGAHQAGEVVVDATGAVFVCTAGGTPGTWVKVGGGGVVTARVNYASGTNIVFTSTTFSEVAVLAGLSTGAFDLTVPASVGDVLELTVSAMFGEAAGNTNMDFLLPGSGVYIGSGTTTPLTQGVSVWDTQGARYSSAGSFQYPVQAGDPSGGNVVLRWVGKSTTGDGYVLVPGTYPLQISVKNFRH